MASANLGESLITRGVVFWGQAIRTSQPAQINIGIGNTVVAPPGVYVLRAEDDKNRYFFGGPPVQSGIVGFEWTGGGLCVGKATGTITGLFQLRGMCPSNNLISPSYENLTVPDGGIADVWRKELIYNGRSGDTIRVIYREYSGDLARPAFTQELQYDLSQQTEIGFREVRLQVEAATNTSIRYRVLQTFSGSAPGT